MIILENLSENGAGLWIRIPILMFLKPKLWIMLSGYIPMHVR